MSRACSVLALGALVALVVGGVPLASAISPPLALGTVGNVQTIACPAGSGANSYCKSGTITASGVAPLVFNIKVSTPGVYNGTVVLHSGGGGTSYFDQGYLSAYYSAKYRVVQIRWATQWEDTGLSAKSILTAAVRPATLVNYIWSAITGGTRSQPFGFHGHSGGSGVGGYLLSTYGLDAILDAVLLSAGPVFGDISIGCQRSSSTVTVCPDGQYGCAFTPGFANDPRYGGSSGSCGLSSGLGLWTGIKCNCGTYTPTPADVSAWKEMSVTATGADYTYPKTAVSQWVCDGSTTSPNNSPGQAQFFGGHFEAGSSAAFVQVLVAGCSGAEDIWTTGFAASLAQMTAHMVPRH